MPDWIRIQGIAVAAGLAITAPANAKAGPNESTPESSSPKVEAQAKQIPEKSPPSSKEPAKKRPLSTRRKALAVAASIAPGALVHGAGHFVAGDPTTGFRLLTMEGVGFGLTAGSLSLLAATGASRRFTTPLAALTAVGAGLFAISWLADIYGVAMPEPARGSPPLGAPFVETQLGARYVYDPTFAYRMFLVPSIDLRWRSLRLMPSAWFATDDVNARLRALAAYRISGPTPTRSDAREVGAPDGSFLDLETAVTHHRYGATQAGALGSVGGFAVTTVEASLHGRLDAQHIAEPLRGSFIELGAGGAVAVHSYPTTTEGNTLLLVRFAYGVYIGRPCAGAPGCSFSSAGEAKVYYDHRHDDYAAGLKVRGLGSGVPGHFGLTGSLFFTPSWGVSLDAQVGSAYVAGASLVFRQGGLQ
ncbi:MAG TPA: hypothetical protein VE093_18750 [Polyangiaceae bacterium]|nr:hypothetical protein [Polyangiaceae bacterium]